MDAQAAMAVHTQAAPFLPLFRMPMLGLARRAHNNPTAGGHNRIMMYTI
jgi:hypothetical protein